ncbi:MAG: hypothetical protein IJ691_00755 [Lachnospiraceae bacterium]|nr:hypothetical protein [Lachnospiraceae bacterium]
MGKVELPMYFNTIGNVFRGIAVYGDNELAAELLLYYREIEGLFVEKCDNNPNDDMVIVSDKVEVVIKCEDKAVSFLHNDGSKCYSFNYNTIRSASSTNPFEDIYLNIAPALTAAGVKIVFVHSPNLHMYKHKIPLCISMGIFSLYYSPNSSASA